MECTLDYIDAGYQCTCLPEFVGDGEERCDLDPCLSGENTCSEHALCEALASGYNCTCKKGFAGDGESCEPCKNAY